MTAAPRGRTVIPQPARPPKGPGIGSLVVLVLVLIFAFGVGAGLAARTDLTGRRASTDTSAPRDDPASSPRRPIRIVIPAIGVRADVHTVGLAADGSIETPDVHLPNEAGWYSTGPAPGEAGPAVIVGHVDTTTGPAVFADLHTLRPGSRIEITGKDRRVTVFEVNTVERFPKDRCPARRIFDDFSRPSLRLITCGGPWVGGETGYTDNVIVFASLAGSRAG